MPKLTFVRFLLINALLLIVLPITQAQVNDFCDGLADEIAYNETIEASISDIEVFGRYCFNGRADDVVSIQIETIEGDLILSGVLSDRSLDEIIEEYTAADSEEIIEITFTLPEDGSYLLLVSRENFGEGTTSGTYSLALTSDNAPIGNDADESIFPETINNYAGYWENVINAFRNAEAIGLNGNLIFNVRTAFFDGVGSFFTPIASSTSRRDVIVAANLTLTTDGDSLETCSLLARVIGRDAVSTFLEVGLDSNGDVFWVDAKGDDIRSGSVELGLDLSESHHLLFIAQSSNLTIYLDGQLIVEMAEITVGSGSFGIALIGGGTESRCDGANVWGYEAPVVIDGLCEATPLGNVNQRESASTNAEVVDSLLLGTYTEVIATTTDNTDFIWYELSDGSFVREDVVSIVGDCANLPASE